MVRDQGKKTFIDINTHFKRLIKSLRIIFEILLCALETPLSLIHFTGNIGYGHTKHLTQYLDISYSQKYIIISCLWILRKIPKMKNMI